jgi:hypothetical protein
LAHIEKPDISTELRITGMSKKPLVDDKKTAVPRRSPARSADENLKPAALQPPPISDSTNPDRNASNGFEPRFRRIGKQAAAATGFGIRCRNTLVATGDRTPDSTDGRKRVIIEGVTPEIDGGRFPIKRTVGETVVVEADVFTDGHDALSCILQYRKAGDADWREARCAFGQRPLARRVQVLELGSLSNTPSLAWVDAFKSWRHDLSRWVEAEDIAMALRVGEQLVDKASRRATGEDAKWLKPGAPRRTGRSDQDLDYRRQLGWTRSWPDGAQRRPQRWR